MIGVYKTGNFSFMEKTMGETIQRQTRIPVRIKAELAYGEVKDKCEIIDISKGGILVESNRIFAAGDLVQITANLTPTFQLNIWGIVRNVKIAREIGIEFDEISNEQRTQLTEYVFETLNLNDKDRFEKINLT